MSERITFIAKKGLAEEIENEAERLNVTKSEIIRQAVARNLAD